MYVCIVDEKLSTSKGAKLGKFFSQNKKIDNKSWTF